LKTRARRIHLSPSPVFLTKSHVLIISIFDTTKRKRETYVDCHVHFREEQRGEEKIFMLCGRLLENKDVRSVVRSQENAESER
jgi:hypothetical protein